MGVNNDEWYVQRAIDTLYRGGECEIDSDAIVSNGDDAGAYVSAWVWVPDDEVPDDNDSDDTEEDE
jgi:hypothetical protein